MISGPRKAYGRNESTIGDNGHACASVTVHGFGDGLRVRILVHGDCLDVTSNAWGRTGGGDVGALLDWTAWIDAGALGSAIQVSGK